MKYILSALFICVYFCITAQTVLVEGYVYETGNRGYLNEVSIKAYHPEDGLIASTTSNQEGYYFLSLPLKQGIKILANKDLFHESEQTLDLLAKSDGDKIFVKTEMQRAPGYIFEITLAPKRMSEDIAVDAIRGAHIEVYNNTTKKEILNLMDHQEPDFRINLLKGNHYTILVRKEGYLAKRMEAYVDVKECILCFEGVGDVRPEVADNLTGSNSNGTLLANVELDPLFVGKKIEVQNIYYDLGKYKIRDDARTELDKIAVFIKDNPRLNIELGSHTDSRGSAESNMSLSERRADAAVAYLRNTGGIARNKISFKGYGETQLTNKCADGVECTEEEHQQNRRTELKILGLDGVEEYKSLYRMKSDEDMEKMILSLGDEDQIRIPANGDIPEELKKAIAAKENEEDAVQELQKVEGQFNTSEITNTEELIQITSDEIVQPAAAPPAMEKTIETDTKEMLKNKMDGQEDRPSAMEVEVPISIELEDEIEMERQAAIEVQQAVEDYNNTIKSVREDDSTSVSKSMDTIMEDKDLNQIVIIDPMSSEKLEAETLNTDLNGSKIVIHYSNIEIPVSHKIYKKHAQVDVYKEGAFYYYLIGKFDSEAEANKFKKLYVIREYPNAYVMNFVDGVRMKN